MKKRLLSMILTVCMVLTLLPAVALAADTTGTFGAFTVTYDDSSTVPTYDSSTLTLGEGNYTIAQTAGVTTATTDKIVVVSGVAANITLNGVNIDVNNTDMACAFDMTGATVNLTLNGTNTLKSGNNKAGLAVPQGDQLTISGTGSLTATGLDNAAGIGGGYSLDCGTIVINGGTVSAVGGSEGAGIGGGFNGSGGTVSISGGTVSATGGSKGAGIGGGSNGSVGTVSISGGTVIAAGGSRGAGIGGGNGGDFEGTVNISGGTVSAVGGSEGAGIGGGYKGSGGTVSISGGTVIAAGGSDGADAIGHGFNASVQGLLQNSGGSDVQLYTLTLSGVTSATAVMGLTLPGSYSYRITDMKTDDNGKLYIYIPAGKTGEVTVTTATTKYTGSITSNAATLLPTAPTYTITKDAATNGSYTVKVGDSEVSSAEAGDTVTITPTANSGYEVDTISVYKTGDTNTTVTVSGNTFIMPTYAVTVSVTFKAVSTPPAGGGGGSGGVTPTSPAVPVIVDGKTENIGSSETTTNETKVTVDSNKLTEKINAAGTSGSVQVPVSDGKTVATAEIVVKNVEDMAKKNMTLEVKSGNVSYQLPTTAIDTATAMEALGASDASKVPLSVTITKLDESTVKVVNGELVVPPVEFTVTVTYSGKTVEISSFSKYVQRSIEISKEQASQITTAVVKNEDGTLRHVPTYVYEKDGKWFADINSRTNSTYALIHNETTFADTHGKWYENIVTEMASRKIISGKNSTAFDGDASITRAEFASIVIRALGLPADGKCSFTDVKSSDWYYGSVGTAVEYGLVSGCTDSSFAPNANITRQEAMVIVQRAAKIAEFTGTTSTLSAFTDSDKVSSWAKSAAEFSVGSGLMVGSNGELRPKADISKAEAATVILRLLQKARLVDVRSKI